MDIEKLIEQYMQAADKWGKRHPVTDTFDLRVQDALRDAATALSTLQTENKKLRAELEQVKQERDVAVEYLRGQCRYCKRNLVCTSRKGPHSNCWEWRGPQKED